MATILKFPVRATNIERKAAAFYFSMEKLTDQHQRIETPMGPAYIRVEMTPAKELSDVILLSKEISDRECFMNGHWVHKVESV
jgi:hypothetical protein